MRNKDQNINCRFSFRSYFSYFIFLIIFIFLISGCQSKLEWLDEKIGEELDKLQEEQRDAKDGEESREKQEKQAKDLNQEEKEKIDKWLEKNNLNRYGDPKDTMYTGGTPLFNEAAGESIDRYDYILNNHPEIGDLIY